MITLYVSPSCTSCRKAKAWLEKNGLNFIEKNILNEPLTINEIKSIIRMTEEGTHEIISTRSKTFHELNINLDELKLNELYEVIIKHPSILKRPILMDEKRLLVGYNDEEIRSFLPRKVREYQAKQLLQKAN
ncbi:transcriptional regulator SpxA [Bacillus salitolerans]|uniref:Global transcriptional regulator Spx n=1 Tax=Bacillus salitolerans TaxID=1437434 RepID=A0ABW4LQ34_9BACI